MAEKFKAMVISVGTGKEGKDIAHGICFSIQQQNPDFLVFLNTSESRKKTMPFVLEYCIDRAKKFKEIDLPDPDDVEKLTIDCQHVIQGLVSDGYDPVHMVVDYTSGTKAMSAGLTIAAVREKVGTLTYISGKRGEGGRVISGTEKALSIIPNRIFANDFFQEAVDSFNTYHFDVSLKILKEATHLLPDPDFIKKASLFEKLSEAYASWDRFEVEKAFELLRNIRQEPILRDWKIEKQIDLNKQALHREKENWFCPERIFDLLENAVRRGDGEQKFDDAVARLYRVCEYIGQYELNQLGLYKTINGQPDTSDLDLLRLPVTLQEKYFKYRDSYDGKVKLHLSGDFGLLYDLEHPRGVFFKEEGNKFKKLLALRDCSILAHGFNPISENSYKEMLRLIEGFIEVEKFGDSNLRDRVKFPRIKL